MRGMKSTTTAFLVIAAGIFLSAPQGSVLAVGLTDVVTSGIDES